MGDISAEPSMEDILSSIKRIIAEDGEPARPRRALNTRGGVPEGGRPLSVPSSPLAGARDDVLELNDPIADEDEPMMPGDEAPPRATAPRPSAPARATSREPAAAEVSAATVEATRGALDALSRLIVKPEQSGSDTLEGLVRELLRPMLAQWLDAHLPALVEQMVAREIARISGSAE